MANAIMFMSHLLRKTTMTPSRHLCSRFTSMNKDLLRPSYNEQTTAIQNQDILLGSLKTATSAHGVLDIVHSHVNIMNVKHIMQALRSLFQLQKSGNSKLSTKQILKHSDFDLLCKKLRKQAGAIELNETIEALKVVCYVGVPSDSTIVQVLLHLLKHQINYMSLHQIIFLDFLLNQMKSTPLLEAIQLALPLVFEIQLPIKVDKENIAQLAECLFFATKKSVSSKCIEYLVNSVADYQGDIDPKTTLSLLWSLCDLNSDAFFEPLVKRLINNVIIDIDHFSFGDIETTVSKLATRCTHRYKFYYNDILCDLLANHVIDNDLGHEAAIYTFKKLNKLFHTNEKLLDYTTNKFIEDEQRFHSLDEPVAFLFIKALALTDIRPMQWSRLKCIIEESNIFEKLREVNEVRLAASLCLLDIYREDVLRTSLEENNVREIVKSGNITKLANLIHIKQAVMTFKPEFEHLLPSDQTYQRIQARLKTPTEYPLEGALLNVFGGHNYIKTGITTSLHHHIDHLIVLREGGYPVAFATPDIPQAIEDIVLTENSQMIAILGLGAQHYTSNSKQLRSITSLAIRTLQKKNCTVIPINLEDWQELADFERIPYLMQLIKTRTHENELLQDAGV